MHQPKTDLLLHSLVADDAGAATVLLTLGAACKHHHQLALARLLLFLHLLPAENQLSRPCMHRLCCMHHRVAVDTVWADTETEIQAYFCRTRTWLPWPLRLEPLAGPLLGPAPMLSLPALPPLPARPRPSGTGALMSAKRSARARCPVAWPSHMYVQGPLESHSSRQMHLHIVFRQPALPPLSHAHRF
jgi:hypothetical protein